MDHSDHLYYGGERAVNSSEFEIFNESDRALSEPSSKVIDHLNHPRHAGPLNNPDAVGKASRDGRAPRVTIYLRVDGSIVNEASFETFGCGYAIALCSVLTEFVIGQPTSRCAQLTADDIIDALDGVPSQRRFCAQIAIDAMRDALDQLSRGEV